MDQLTAMEIQQIDQGVKGAIEKGKNQFNIHDGFAWIGKDPIISRKQDELFCNTLRESLEKLGYKIRAQSERFPHYYYISKDYK
jgi:hypothetical protein